MFNAFTSLVFNFSLRRIKQMNSDTKLPFLILAVLVALIGSHEVEMHDVALAYADKTELVAAKSYK
jgi:hypothetical protein